MNNEVGLAGTTVVHSMEAAVEEAGVCKLPEEAEYHVRAAHTAASLL